MLHSRTAVAILDRDFLEIRARILDIAAALDRLDRAEVHSGDGHSPDRRLTQIRQSIEALLEPGPGRAETIQRLFSLPYEPEWRADFDLAPTRP